MRARPGGGERSPRDHASKAGEPRVRIEPLQLPKGGGAITGLSGHFGLNEFSGTAQLNIPFPLPPGRGLAPELTLTYTSGGGNGLFGVGFSLDPPAIARKTNKGIPRYEDSDRFSLDGGPALVALSGQPQARSVDGRAYTVTAYRPRSFAEEMRIEQWSATDGSESFWRTIDSGNHITLFGRTAAARIADPDDARCVFAWLIEWEADAHGNAISYAYKAEDDQGLAGRPGEAGRRYGANRHLERIRYTNAAPVDPSPIGIDDPGALTWLIEVVADYGEYDITAGNDHPYTPVRPWTARQDPFSAYAAGFERRTARLCRSLLLFHRFAADLGPEPVLVRALTFQYDENPTLTRLTGAVETGFRFCATCPAGQRTQSRSLPSLQLDYTAFAPQAARFVPLERQDGSPLPGIDGPPGFALVDLYGHGAPGILYADGTSTFYRAPCAANCNAAGALRYAPPRACPQFALERRVAGLDVALVDLDGDSRLELEVVGGTHAGSYKIFADGGWSTFRPFERVPTEYHVAAAEHFDLTGDGAPDVVIMRQDGVRYYPSAGAAGYGAPVDRRDQSPSALAAPPPATPFNPDALVRFADLCGAGSPQRVRIGNGRATCWPSLGHGRFAPPIDLGNAPLFGGAFDAQRIILADLDGSGASDLVYAEAERLLIYGNQSGNGFAAEPVIVPLPARCTRPEQIRVADARGNGWDCLIFTDDTTEPRQWLLDLCGGMKPYMLNRVRNGVGSETRIGYASSTRFQLEDHEAGSPWRTNLSIPVQVVARVEECEQASGQCKVTSYRYRDGVMDGIEREFRGFGFIERRETEAVPDPAPGVTVAATTLVTRVWYHTGVGAGSEQATDQAFGGDTAACAMPGTLHEWPAGFVQDAETERQAILALAGNTLREEVADGSQSAPFSVTQSRYRVRLLQPRGDNDPVFLVADAETIHYDFERDAADPRTSHACTTQVDDDGTVLQSVALNYPRRAGRTPQDPEQSALRALCSAFTPMPRLVDADTLLFGLAADEQDFALSALPAPDSGGYYSLAQMTALVAAALATRQSAPAAELLSRTRHFWVSDANGAITPQALPLRSDEAVFAPAAITGMMDGVPVPGGLDDYLGRTCGYIQDDGLWWQPGTQASYAPAAHFHLLSATRDAFAQRSDGPSGAVVTCSYDAYDLMLTAVETSGRDGDVTPQRVAATRIDYQSLAAVQITDQNGTVTEVLTDPLGLVVATSTRGTEWNGSAAVPVGFVPLPLDDPSSWPVAPSAAALLADPAHYLGGAQAVFLTVFSDPASAAPSAEIIAHATSYPGAPGTANGIVEVGVFWTDGRGRVVQASELAGPQQWRITGRDILLSSGEPWRQFHPAYAAVPDFVAASALGTLKIAATHAYDTLDRPVRSSVPRADLWEAFFATTVYGAWQITESDLNDTIKDSAWYQRYVDPGDPDAPALPQAEKDALIQAARFHATPSTTVLGSNGYPVRQIARPTADEGDAMVTRHRVDAAGRIDAEADPRLGAAGLWNLQRSFSLTGEPLVVTTADGGTSRGLSNALGKPVFAYDALGRLILPRYDSLARTIDITLQQRDGTTRTVERIVYGDSLDGSGQPLVPGADGRNLLGQIVRHYDPTGCTEIPAYAICDEPLGVARRFLADYTADPDWSCAAAAGWTWPAQAAALDALLDGERFAITRRYDALGRPVGGTDPAGNDTQIGFGLTGHVESLSVAPKDAARFTYLNSIAYDADGKRAAERALAPGGGVIDRSFGYDADNRRLVGITSKRSSDGAAVQALAYVYDPVGNITRVDDGAAPGPSVVAGGQVVTPTRDFTYDALYRLTGATGRAHTALTRDNAARGGYEPFFAASGALTDPTALYRYSVGYDYDNGGNLTEVRFFAPPDQPGARWTRTLSVDIASNRAVDTDTLGSQPISAFFDAAGNQTRTGGLPALIWEYRDRLRKIVLVDRGSAQPDAQYLAHDGSGLRVRKTTQRVVGSGGLRVEDTFYFGGLEITRVRQSGAVVEERQRLRLMDEDACVAERLSWTVGSPPAGVNGPQLRFQIEDHQGSSALELDDQGKLVSYEEYAPYGVTVYATGPSLAEVSLKRYRFGGKERDQDTGLYDYGARHYAPWLGRWLSPDPAGPVDGLNLYAFVGGNPVTWEDIGGLGTGHTKKKAAGKTKRKVKKQDRSNIKAGKSISAAGKQRAAQVASTTRQSDRLKKVNEDKAAQFAPSAGAVGHYYRGSEHLDLGGRKKLYGSLHTLHEAIRKQLEADFAKFKKTGLVLPGVPPRLAKYASDNWKRDDFFDAAHEQITHPRKVKVKITRPVFSAGKIVPRDGSAPKLGASDPHGGINTAIDDRGHSVPEKGVSDAHAIRVNGPDNVLPENWVINQQYKTAFENGVKELAARNPKLHVMTIHQPNYKSSKGAEASARARPKEINHFVAMNGSVVSAFTFKNSKKVIEARR